MMAASDTVRRGSAEVGDGHAFAQRGLVGDAVDAGASACTHLSRGALWKTSSFIIGPK